MVRSILRLFSSLSVILMTNTAHAGDASTLNIIGFNDDGRVFAFEEYGVQDGSGFPYANRFYIDTATDAYVAGSPVRVRLDDEMASTEDARHMAQDQADAAGFPADMSFQPGFASAQRSITEHAVDPYLMVANPRPVFPPIDAPIGILLTEKSFLPSGPCEGIQDATVGFTLTRLGMKAGQTARTLHDDIEQVPASRGCPLGYRLGGIFTFYPQNGQAVMAVIVAIRTFGFEGPDHRWMAVTTRIE